MSPSEKRILKATADLEPAVIRSLYDGFNSPIAELDCGKECAPHNSSGKLFCCDIGQAVPAAYKRAGWLSVSPEGAGVGCVELQRGAFHICQRALQR